MYCFVGNDKAPYMYMRKKDHLGVKKVQIMFQQIATNTKQTRNQYNNKAMRKKAPFDKNQKLLKQLGTKMVELTTSGLPSVMDATVSERIGQWSTLNNTRQP